MTSPRCDNKYDYPDDDNYDYSLDCTWELSVTQDLIIMIVVIVLTLITFIFGVTSWCIMKKFRTYKNYVFLNAILSNLLYFLCRVWILKEYDIYGLDILVTLKYYDKYSYYACEYILTVRFHWLIVISHMFFVDIVKVFSGNIQNKYLKSAIFGWGISLITATICATLRALSILNYSTLRSRFGIIVTTIIAVIMSFGNQVLPGILNCYFYIRTVFTLWLSYNASAQTPSYIWRRLYIATLILILSDAMLLYNSLIKFMFNANNRIANFFVTLFGEINPLILDVFFIILRSNRKLWHDLYIHRFNKMQRDNDINMHNRITNRITRHPGCFQPTVFDAGKFKSLPEL
ncbi:hypothetical protein PYW08_004989 [Mythimna loreyi]|uniref:Uncharacterized protein n=1 Tax=Mythimna loreyi TaxID=667449 RepID=A0ACC2QDR8_9NEOP|nr:hypothetical protein PYW08_004989 [Mythimna loreyi]